MLGLLAVLAPDVVYRADAAAQRTGSRPALFGAEAVAANFHGRAQAARPALVDGVLGLAVAIGDGPIFVVLRLVLDGDRIAGLEAVADPQRLAAFEIQVLEELRTGDLGDGEAGAGR
jgi:RNA polymerase sigma-70 factor (ECF subfamily)